MIGWTTLLAMLCVVPSVPVVAGDNEDPNKSEIKRLAGEWYQSHSLSNGFKVTVQGFSLVLFFRDEEVKEGRIFSPDDIKSLDSWKYTVDASRSPKTIDLSRTKNGKKETRLGIYELKGNDLKVSWAGEGQERPTKLDDKIMPINFYFRLEKKK
jgi:uncharacterized protein (TIGR03067 family)